MNRESEAHFSHLPQINIKRSKFNRPITHKTTMNAAQIIPIYVDSDIMPGDTVQIDMGAVIRESTPIAPVMDNAYVDIMGFFCPHRLVWSHFKEFWGENTLTAWESEIEYEIPTVKAPEGGWEKGSLADYFGIPTKIGGPTELNPNGLEVNALPGRAYCKIFNDWFRDTALQDGVMFNEDETTLTGKNGSDANYDKITDTQLLAAPLKACKYHDRFTSALPEPQYGPSVKLPIVAEDSKAHVMTYGMGEPYKDDWLSEGGGTSLLWVNSNQAGKETEDRTWSSVTTNNLTTTPFPAQGAGITILGGTGTGTSGNANPVPLNLYADLGIINTAITIQELRQSIALQEFYEALARGGNRYIEIIKAIFDVNSSDARLQRSEYLGGMRRPINMDQVLQTSGTASEPTPLGNTGAFSMTALKEYVFEKSFEEHGTLMIMAIIRTDHTYQQGLHPMWSRRKREHFYNPYFANLGEQAIKNKEIYCQGTATDEEVFGYQEAWSEYRYGQSMVTGAMRSNYDQSLDIWHYADYYESLPTLSDEWIEETQKNIDRTIAVQSDLENQFICDFYFDANYIRPMPVYSVPGIERI